MPRLALDPERVEGFNEIRRIAVAGLAASGLLAASNIVTGLAAGSTAVLAMGFEFAGDVLSSSLVLVGAVLAARPPDGNHPYGHGRLETLAGLLVGVILVVGGIGVAYHSLRASTRVHPPPGVAALWVLGFTIILRTAMAALKAGAGRRLSSRSLVADAWNDAVDVLSAAAALVAVGLARMAPDRFPAADHYGGFAVGLVVVVTGVRVVRDASMDLADTMPPAAFMADVRRHALEVPGVMAVEKHFARKTGLQYHVDLHIEVDGHLTVRASHDIASRVRESLRATLPWVADVLVHIEPSPDPRGTRA